MLIHVSPHITRACQEVVFQTVQLAQEFFANAKTSKGLNVFTGILDEAFETKRKITEDYKETMQIRLDDYLPQWNYVAVPVYCKLTHVI